MRDLHEIGEAERCAHEAIGVDNRSFQPHNLLAAICFSRGEHKMGEQHLQAAVERGASDKDLENAIYGIDLEYRRMATQYLLDADPVKYAWASRYS